MAVEAGKEYQLNGGRISVVPFQTFHRVQSIGYLLYKHDRHLKAEYLELPGCEIGALRRKGVEIYDYSSTAEIAYTGDTTIHVFEANPVLFQVRVLITEVRTQQVLNDIC